MISKTFTTIRNADDREFRRNSLMGAKTALESLLVEIDMIDDNGCYPMGADSIFPGAEGTIMVSIKRAQHHLAALANGMVEE